MTSAGTAPERSVYLDANASELLRPAALKAVREALDLHANPSALHRRGQAARHLLRQARKILADFFQTVEEDVIFTSGATEANFLAVAGLLPLNGERSAFRPLIAGAGDHPSLLRAAEYHKKIHPEAELAVMPLLPSGQPDAKFLAARLRHYKERGLPPSLVCLTAANNETGIIADMQAIARICAEYDARLHVDAAQIAGRGWRLPELPALSLFSAALSAHKMGGLSGAGALVLKPAPHLNYRFYPPMGGGGQERGKRGGTQNLAGIASMGAAFAESRTPEALENWRRVQALRNNLEKDLAAVGARIIGRGEKRLPNTICAVLEGVSSQVQLMSLDLKGFCVSAGSACSSGKSVPSSVLQAMGEDRGAGEMIRISLPYSVQAQEVRDFGRTYQEMAQNLGVRRA